VTSTSNPARTSLPSNHQSAKGAVLYQRGAKPHDKGHLDIIFHNSRAESPDYHSNVFTRAPG